MIHATQTQIKIHHASSIRPIKKKLFSDEILKIYILNATTFLSVCSIN